MSPGPSLVVSGGLYRVRHPFASYVTSGGSNSIHYTSINVIHYEGDASVSTLIARIPLVECCGGSRVGGLHLSE